MLSDYSVLMPLWYKETPKFLETSLKSMAAQTILPKEFVFVRDHDIPPELMTVIESSVHRIPVVFVDAFECYGKGLGAILAKGVESCKYPLIARMDSDDISTPDRCEKQLQIFNQYSNVDIVGGTLAEFTSDPNQITGYRKLPQNNDKIKEFCKLRSPFNHPTVMFKKDTVLKVGNYDAMRPKCEDYDLWYRILSNGGAGYNLQEVVLRFRAGNDMLMRRKDKRHYMEYCALKKRMYNAHFIGIKDYAISIMAQTFFYYVPMGTKRFLYQKVLRNT